MPTSLKGQFAMAATYAAVAVYTGVDLYFGADASSYGGVHPAILCPTYSILSGIFMGIGIQGASQRSLTPS